MPGAHRTRHYLFPLVMGRNSETSQALSLPTVRISRRSPTCSFTRLLVFDGTLASDYDL
jgi:hypothetical protein